jgi:hypothetical protein
VIDSLPSKRYEAPHTDVTEDGEEVEDVSLSRENSRDESTLQLENADCCPICLVEYEDRVSEIRTLPCGHFFDKECIDSWFADHTTCPSCREDIDNTRSSAALGGLRHSHWDRVDETPDSTPQSTAEATAASINEQYDSNPRWQYLSAFDIDSRRRHSHWDGADATPEAEDVSPPGSDEETSSEDDHGHQMHSIRPRFLSIRRFFSRRGHLAVPGDDDDEEEVNNESIELV